MRTFNDYSISTIIYSYYSDDLSKQVTDEFLSLFNFSGTRIDAALRTFVGLYIYFGLHVLIF